MILSEALEAAKGEKKEITVSEFLEALLSTQLSQYDKVFNAAIEKEYCDLDIALRVLDSKAAVLREWVQLAFSDGQDA